MGRRKKDIGSGWALRIAFQIFRSRCGLLVDQVWMWDFLLQLQVICTASSRFAKYLISRAREATEFEEGADPFGSLRGTHLHLEGRLDSAVEVRAARVCASNGGSLPHLLRYWGGAVDPPLLLPWVYGGRALYVLAGVTTRYFIIRNILQTAERR